MSGGLRQAWLAGDRAAIVELDRWVDGPARPRWAVGIVTACGNAGQTAPADLPGFRYLRELPDVPERWHEARDVFDRLRTLTLELQTGGDPDLAALVLVAESAAKVVYNAAGPSAPFDLNSGEVLVGRAGQIASRLGPESVAARSIWHAVRPKP